MNDFIQITDYATQIRTEILDAIINSDPVVLELAEQQAIEEMRGYLADKYNVDVIFSATGTNRNSVVLEFAIDIVLYNLHSSINPMRFPQVRKDRYDRAIAWLKSVQRSEVTPNLPLRIDESGNSGAATSFTIQSNPKRITQY